MGAASPQLRPAKAAACAPPIQTLFKRFSNARGSSSRRARRASGTRSGCGSRAPPNSTSTATRPSGAAGRPAPQIAPDRTSHAIWFDAAGGGRQQGPDVHWEAGLDTHCTLQHARTFAHSLTHSLPTHSLQGAVAPRQRRVAAHPHRGDGRRRRRRGRRPGAPGVRARRRPQRRQPGELHLEFRWRLGLNSSLVPGLNARPSCLMGGLRLGRQFVAARRAAGDWLCNQHCRPGLSPASQLPGALCTQRGCPLHTRIHTPSYTYIYTHGTPAGAAGHRARTAAALFPPPAAVQRRDQRAGL